MSIDECYKTHRIHVWHIYLYLVDFDGINVGKFTIHYMDPMGDGVLNEVMVIVSGSLTQPPWWSPETTGNPGKMTFQSTREV